MANRDIRVMASENPLPGTHGSLLMTTGELIHQFDWDAALIVYMRDVIHVLHAGHDEHPSPPFWVKLTDRELCLWRSSALAGALFQAHGDKAYDRYLSVIKMAQDAEAAGKHVYFVANWG